MFKLKTEIVKPVEINLIDEESLSVQSKLVLEQRYTLYSTVCQANARLDEKANVLLQAGAIIIGLVSIFSLPSFDALTLGAKIAIILAYGVFLLTVLLSLTTISPLAYEAPGSTDWDKTFDKYLHANIDSCFDMVLQSLHKSIDSHVDLNNRKSKLVNTSIILLMFQVGSLLVAVLLA